MSRIITNRGIRPVSTIEEVQRYAPSVFASHPSDKVSSRYHFVDTKEVIDAIMSNGWRLSGVQENRVRPDARNFGYQKHVIRFRAQDSGGQAIRVGDVSPELVLMNSHDGSSRFMFAAGLFRFVCTNGLVVADSTFASLRVMHTSKELDAVVENARRVLYAIPSVLGRVDAMRSRVMTDDERHAFARQALRLRFADNFPGAALPSLTEGILTPKRKEDADPTLWQTMNVLQENLTHGFSYTGANFTQRKARPVTGLRPAFDLNRQLWSLADYWMN